MNCPKCGLALVDIDCPSYMNQHQWDAIKAGDYYRYANDCTQQECPVDRAGSGNSPEYRYATDRDLELYNDEEAKRKGWE